MVLGNRMTELRARLKDKGTKVMLGFSGRSRLCSSGKKKIKKGNFLQHSLQVLGNVLLLLAMSWPHRLTSRSWRFIQVKGRWHWTKMPRHWGRYWGRCTCLVILKAGLMEGDGTQAHTIQHSLQAFSQTTLHKHLIWGTSNLDGVLGCKISSYFS